MTVKRVTSCLLYQKVFGVQYSECLSLTLITDYRILITISPHYHSTHLFATQGMAVNETVHCCCLLPTLLLHPALLELLDLILHAQQVVDIVKPIDHAFFFIGVNVEALFFAR